jgi:hypothetical protein
MSATRPSLGPWDDAVVRLRTLAAVTALLLVLPACTSGKKPDPNAGMARARARLAVLAQATATNSYDASYGFRQLPSNSAGYIRIRQAPPQYRIDVVSKSSGASFFSLASGTVSCAQRSKRNTCFLVALPGEEVPALFDPGVQRLFRDAVEDLAANPTDYLVTALGTASPGATPSFTATPSTALSTATGTPGSPSPSASPGGLPVGECFAVVRASGAPPATERGGFEDGTYCFAEQGVATSIEVASGTLTLGRLLGPPPAIVFKPTTKVVRLPDLATPKPTPTPSQTPS